MKLRNALLSAIGFVMLFGSIGSAEAQYHHHHRHCSYYHHHRHCRFY